jgi:hypothetical protein
MPRSRLLMAVIAAGACGVVGVAVGISSSAAASPHKAPSGSHSGAPWSLFGPGGATGATGVRGRAFPGLGRGGSALPGFGLGGGAVHSVTVVPNSSGGFTTVTTDSGVLKSISGDALTITEGTTSATYATPTITVGSDAKVFLDGRSSTLTALVAPDRVTIAQISGGATTVLATDSSVPSPFGSGTWPGRGLGGGRFGAPPLGATGASGATGTRRPRGAFWGGATGASGARGTWRPRGASWGGATGASGATGIWRPRGAHWGGATGATGSVSA